MGQTVTASVKTNIFEILQAVGADMWKGLVKHHRAVCSELKECFKEEWG